MFAIDADGKSLVSFVRELDRNERRTLVVFAQCAAAGLGQRLFAGE